MDVQALCPDVAVEPHGEGIISSIQRRLFGVVEGGNLDRVMHNWDRFLD